MRNPGVTEASYRLSVDEVAMILSQSGHADAARQTLAIGGADVLDGGVIRGRLQAAGHSLMARGLLDVIDDGVIELDPAINRLVGPLASADFSIRLARSDGETDWTITFHFSGDVIVQHTIERDIVHELTECCGEADVVETILDLLGVGEHTPFKAGSCTVTASVINDLQTTADRDTALAMLADAGMFETVRQLFVDDFMGVVSRGTISRIDYDDEEASLAEGAIMTLHGPERFWLMVLQGQHEAPEMEIMPGDRQTFEGVVKRLIKGSP